MPKAKVIPLPTARQLTPAEQFNSKRHLYIQAILASAQPKRPGPVEDRLEAVETKLDAVLDLLQRRAHQ